MHELSNGAGAFVPLGQSMSSVSLQAAGPRPFRFEAVTVGGGEGQRYPFEERRGWGLKVECINNHCERKMPDVDVHKQDFCQGKLHIPFPSGRAREDFIVGQIFLNSFSFRTFPGFNLMDHRKTRVQRDGYGVCPKHPLNQTASDVYDHTTLKAPVLVRSPKLSNVGPG